MYGAISAGNTLCHVKAEMEPIHEVSCAIAVSPGLGRDPPPDTVIKYHSPNLKHAYHAIFVSINRPGWGLEAGGDVWGQHDERLSASLSAGIKARKDIWRSI